MEVDTVLFGKMQIPDDIKSINAEIERCKNRFYTRPTKYLQCRVDCLEEVLDLLRRDKDV